MTKDAVTGLRTYLGYRRSPAREQVRRDEGPTRWASARISLEVEPPKVIRRTFQRLAASSYELRCCYEAGQYRYKDLAAARHRLGKFLIRHGRMRRLASHGKRFSPRTEVRQPRTRSIELLRSGASGDSPARAPHLHASLSPDPRPLAPAVAVSPTMNGSEPREVASVMQGPWCATGFPPVARAGDAFSSPGKKGSEPSEVAGVGAPAAPIAGA
jgi:hypothetical protein